MRHVVPWTVLLLCAMFYAGCATLQPVYLTWQGDPSTTMTVTTQTPPETKTVWIHYGLEPGNGVPSAYAQQATCATWQIPGLPDERRIHSAALSKLSPGERYYFVLSDGTATLTEEKSFRTIPDDATSLHFICGGDMSSLPRAKRLLRQAARTDPMFGVVGGDIAYANGNLKKVKRWDGWFRNWCETMVTSEGCLVPMVVGIGNHEVNDSEGSESDRAPLYYGFLPQGGRSYFSREFGEGTVIHVLDSGHLAAHNGPQKAWLDEVLTASQDRENQFAVYHVPLYPSHRDYEDRRSEAGRTHWLPLFDAHDMDVCFENHDHTLKRTKPLRDNTEAEDGTVYLGDGCFGVPPRRIASPSRWYLEKGGRTPHFWSVAVDGTRIECTAIGLDGRTVDHYVRD